MPKSTKSSIDSAAEPKQPKLAVKNRAHQVIDTVLSTMYANDAGGYFGVNKQLFKSEALKRIQSQLEGLDKKARSDLEDETKYRLSAFEEFSHLPDSIRGNVLKIAKERHISIEQAYKEKEKK